MTRVTVSRDVLQWALERSGRVADVQRQFPKLTEWTRGVSAPTIAQLEKLAKATLTPLGYFFLEAPPEDRLPIPHFRTIGDESLHRASPDLLETVYTMERRQAWMREYLVQKGHERLRFVRSGQPTAEPGRIAAEIRHLLGLEDGWARDLPSWSPALTLLRNVMENAGILVVVNGIVGNNTRRKLDPDEFRGFVLVDDYAPLVFVNGADFKAAQMFTLAHELAHVWIGSSAAFDLRNLEPAADEIEQACNRVAAEFLVPAAELRDLWPRARQDDEPFQSIARHFKVSVIVAARRALDLRLITKPQFLEFYQAYQEDQRRRSATQEEGGNFYAVQGLRVGRRFAEAIVRAAREGTLFYGEAYRLTGLHGRTFERYAQSLEFR
jgi:Zn-dependent peptidase ImmA (M78 family)